MIIRWLSLALLLAGLGLPRAVGAHAVNLAVAFVQVDGASVQVDLTITGFDVDRAAGLHVTDHGTGMVDPRALREAEATLGAYILERTTLASAAGACRAGVPRISALSDGGVSVATGFACPDGEAIRYRSRAMVDFDAAARQQVMVRTPAGEFVQAALLDAGHDEVLLTGGAFRQIADVLVRYFVLGVEHILVGYDHILFLVAILLWARRAFALVKIVTAFTLAHSITLSLAALDVVRLSPAIVEPAIAATIVFVAMENFWSRDVDRRWRWTFALGLVHGFGFAGVLAEIGLPRGALVQTLAAFNLGVEAGQLAIVAVLLPLLRLADRALSTPPERRRLLVYPLTLMIALAGLWWFAERTVL